MFLRPPSTFVFACLLLALPQTLLAQSPTISEALEMSARTGAPIFAVAGQET